VFYNRVNSRSHWPRGLRHKVSSLAGTLGLSPNATQGMDVCVRLFRACVVLCVGSGLAKG
jgi:hypothetical protein